MLSLSPSCSYTALGFTIRGIFAYGAISEIISGQRSAEVQLRPNADMPIACNTSKVHSTFVPIAVSPSSSTFIVAIIGLFSFLQASTAALIFHSAGTVSITNISQ